MKLVRFTNATPKSRRTIANGAGSLLGRVDCQPTGTAWRRVYEAIGWDANGARALHTAIRRLFQ